MSGMRSMIGAFARWGQPAVGSTVDEVLANAKMDFDIGMESVYTKEGKAIKNQFRTFRTDTDETFGVVKGTYHVMQNKRLLQISDDLVKRGDIEWDKIGMVDNGRKVLAAFKLPEGFTVAGFDDIDQYIYLQNTNDGSGGIRIIPANVRIFCSNQFSHMDSSLRAAGINPRSLTIRHSSKQEERISQLAEAIKIVDHLNEVFCQNAEELLTVQMNQDDRINYYIKTLGLTQKEDLLKGGKDYDANNPYGLGTRGQNTLTELLELELAPTNAANGMAGTAWGTFNTATEYIDHSWSYGKDGKSQDSKVESAIVGSGARMKSKAWDTMTEMYC